VLLRAQRIGDRYPTAAGCAARRNITAASLRGYANPIRRRAPNHATMVNGGCSTQPRSFRDCSGNRVAYDERDVGRELGAPQERTTLIRHAEEHTRSPVSQRSGTLHGSDAESLELLVLAGDGCEHLNARPRHEGLLGNGCASPPRGAPGPLNHPTKKQSLE
jgi:hypothetical protein